MVVTIPYSGSYPPLYSSSAARARQAVSYCTVYGSRGNKESSRDYIITLPHQKKYRIEDKEETAIDNS